MHDSQLMSSTLQLLLTELLSIKEELGAIKARLTVVETTKTGSASSKKPTLDLKMLSRLVGIAIGLAKLMATWGPWIWAGFQATRRWLLP